MIPHLEWFDDGGIITCPDCGSHDAICMPREMRSKHEVAAPHRHECSCGKVSFFRV